MLPDKERSENMLLTHFHAMAQLRDKVNEFVKVLEVEMRKAKKALLKFSDDK
jgi:hypothetical protein